MKKVAIEVFVLSKKHFVCIQVHAEIKVNIFKCFTVQLLPFGQILVTCFVKINDQVPVSLERSNNRRTQKRLLCFFQDRGFDTFTNNMIKYSILFPRTAERVMWPDFSRVFPFAGRRFFARKTFFPVWKRRRNVSICSLSVPLISSLWSLVFIAMLLVLSFFPMYCL